MSSMENMENIKGVAEDDDELNKIVVEMEKEGAEESAKEFKKKLLNLLNGIEEEANLEGIERIKIDLNLFKDPNEEDFLEALRDEIKEMRGKISDFDELEIRPYRSFLVKSLPSNAKNVSCEKWGSEEKKTIWAKDLLKDKSNVIDKIKELRGKIEEYLNEANLIKNQNEENYVCLTIEYLDVVRKEIEELDNALDKYLDLLEKGIAKIKRSQKQEEE